MRKDWDAYYMDIAKVAASRSTCPRKSVGSVIVRDNTIVSTGFNGSISHAAHCDDAGCIIRDGHCIATLHAELNALLSAAKHGSSVAYSTIYVTARPCLNCFKAVYQAGIKRIVYGEEYGDVDYSILKLNANSMPDVVCLNKDSTASPPSDNY